MSGIVHKESLPAQGHVKRRRIDVPPAPAEDVTTRQEDEGTTKPTKDESADAAPTPPTGGAVAPTVAAAPVGSSSSDDDDDDDDGSDGEIERENARLAQLREQRSRRQEQTTAGGTGAPSKTAGGSSAAGPSASPATSGTNSYDHDVLFRNSAWRASAKATTTEEKRKEKWNAVVNRTQESAAHKHFMKNFFK